MYFTEEVEIDIDVEDVYNQMDENDKIEMLELLQSESRKDLFDQFDSEYVKIFKYLYNRYSSLELENKLKQAEILSEIF